MMSADPDSSTDKQVDESQTDNSNAGINQSNDEPESSAQSLPVPPIHVEEAPSPIQSDNEEEEDRDEEEVPVEQSFEDSRSPGEVMGSKDESQEFNLTSEEDIILHQIQDAIDKNDVPRVISIQKAVKDNDEDQWSRLFEMLESQHQTYVLQKENEHEMDLQRLQSQIQRELSEEKMHLAQQLANHKKVMQHNKENEKPAGNKLELDTPIHLALNMKSAAPKGYTSSQLPNTSGSTLDSNHRVLNTGLTSQEVQLLEDVRRKLANQHIDEEDPLVRSSYERLSGVGQQIRNYHRESYETYHRSMLVGLSPTEKHQLSHSNTNSTESYSSPQRQKLSQLNSYHLNRLDAPSILQSPDSPLHPSFELRSTSSLSTGNKRSSQALEDLKQFYESEIADLRRKLKESATISREDNLCQQRIRLVEERLRNANNEILHLHEENAQLRAKCDSLPAQIAELTNENNMFRQRLDEARIHNTEREALIYDMSEKIRKYEERQETTNGASGLGKREHQMMVKLMHDFDSVCVDLDKKSAELLVCERKLYDAKAEITDLKTKLQTTEGEVNHYESEVGYLKNREKGWAGDSDPFNGVSSYFGRDNEVAHGSNNREREAPDSIASLRKSLAELERRKLIDSVQDDDEQEQFSPARPVRKESASPSRYRSGSPSRRAAATDKMREVKGLERRYDDLQLEKRRLETALSHIPTSGSLRSRQNRQEREQLEVKLDRIDRELGSLRMTLKQFQVIKSLH